MLTGIFVNFVRILLACTTGQMISSQLIHSKLIEMHENNNKFLSGLRMLEVGLHCRILEGEQHGSQVKVPLLLISVITVSRCYC